MKQNPAADSSLRRTRASKGGGAKAQYLRHPRNGGCSGICWNGEGSRLPTTAPNKEVVNLEQFRVLTWTATFKKFMNYPCPGSVEIFWKRSWKGSWYFLWPVKFTHFALCFIIIGFRMMGFETNPVCSIVQKRDVLSKTCFVHLPFWEMHVKA